MQRDGGRVLAGLLEGGEGGPAIGGRVVAEEGLGAAGAADDVEIAVESDGRAGHARFGHGREVGPGVGRGIVDPGRVGGLPAGAGSAAEEVEAAVVGDGHEVVAALGQGGEGAPCVGGGIVHFQGALAAEAAGDVNEGARGAIEDGGGHFGAGGGHVGAPGPGAVEELAGGGGRGGGGGSRGRGGG